MESNNAMFKITFDTMTNNISRMLKGIKESTN